LDRYINPADQTTADRLAFPRSTNPPQVKAKDMRKWLDEWQDDWDKLGKG
jgi:hypothetical protein